MPFAPYGRFWGSKCNKYCFVKWSFFFGVFYDPNDPISTHMNGKRMPNSKSAHQITLGSTKTRKMAYDVIKGHWPLMTSVEVHTVHGCHGCHLPAPIHVQITSINVEVRKFQALKRNGTQISLDMTLEIGSQVNGHSRYELNIFQGRCKIVQRIGILSFVTIGRSVRELTSENPRGLHQPPCRRGLKEGCHLFDTQRSSRFIQ